MTWAAIYFGVGIAYLVYDIRTSTRESKERLRKGLDAHPVLGVAITLYALCIWPVGAVYSFLKWLTR